MLLFFYAPVIHLLSLLMPKRQSLWCFGAWFGEKYSDNSRYLFEEASRTPEIEAVWISKRQDIVSSLKACGLRAMYAYSVRGIWTQMRAGTFVCSVNSRDFFLPTVTCRARFVQLWHGSPLKRIGFDVEMTWRKRSVAFIRSKLTDAYDVLVSPAPIFDPIFASAFKIRSERVIRSGYPRNDGLFIDEKRKSEIRASLGVEEGNSFVLYLPTHRDEGRSCEVLVAAIDRLKELESRLAEKRTVLIAKPHFYDAPMLTKYAGQYLRVVHELSFDLYEVLAASDGLVTDYSSVFFDYEILGKPIYFFAPDIDWYRDSGRGMYFRYEVFARDYCVDVDGLIAAIGGGGHLQEGIELNSDRQGRYAEKLMTALVGDV